MYAKFWWQEVIILEETTEIFAKANFILAFISLTAMLVTKLLRKIPTYMNVKRLS